MTVAIYNVVKTVTVMPNDTQAWSTEVNAFQTYSAIQNQNQIKNTTFSCLSTELHKYFADSLHPIQVNK